MCFKTDTILLQYTFYQFQYFVMPMYGGNILRNERKWLDSFN